MDNLLDFEPSAMLHRLTFLHTIEALLCLEDLVRGERVWLGTAPQRHFSLYLIVQLRSGPIEGAAVTDCHGAGTLVDLGL